MTALSHPFRGAGPALVTPMHPDGSVDEPMFRRHVRFVLDEGVHFVVPCGTTGESATMTPAEQATVIRLACEEVAGQVPVMAGAGTNDTKDAVELARSAQKAGANGILSVGPYYNKPTQEGLFRHFRAIAEAVELPVFVYNVPTRTSSNILPSTILRLAREVENIAGVKEASGDLGQVMTLLRERPEGFLVLSGEDDLTYPMLTMGGDGIVSVAANEIPGPMARMCEHAFAGRWRDALEIHWKVLPLLRANFLETNPIPVKTAMEMMGHFDAHFRLPLSPLSDQHREPLRRALEEAGVMDPSAAGAP